MLHAIAFCTPVVCGSDWLAGVLHWAAGTASGLLHFEQSG